MDLNLQDQPMIGISMDIVVIDTPNTYGMFLSRKWTTFVRGYLKNGLITYDYF